MKVFHKTLITAGLCVSMALCAVGCGKEAPDGNQTVATVGEKEMKLGEANFLLRLQQVQTEGYYESMLGSGFYDKDLYGNGTTYGQSFKENVMNQMQEYYILEEKAADYGVALTEEETTKITEAAKAFLEANEEATKEQMTADQATVERVLTLMTVGSKVTKQIYAEANVTVTDEEAAQRGFSYVSVSKGSGDNALSEEEIQQNKEKLTGIAEKVKGGTAIDAAATEAEMTASAGSYSKDNTGYYDEALILALNALKEGEVTDVIETDTQLYVAQLTAELDEDATEQRKQSLISSKQAEYYNGLVTTWKSEYPLTVEESVWKQVVFDRSYDLAQ